MNGWMDMDGGNWIWMSLMMLFWLIALGAIVYGAVRLAGRRPND
jgi:hypothetical protein